MINLPLTLTVILPQQVPVIFMDSYASTTDMYTRAMVKYLQDDVKDKGVKYPQDKGKTVILTPSQFKIDSRGVEDPLQSNAVDCGVFVCAFAYCLCNHLPLSTFKQDDMPFFRNHILCSILNEKLIDLMEYPNFPFEGLRR